MTNDIVIFKNGELELEVTVSENRENVWLSQRQMAKLFNVSTDNIGLHIKNILADQELDCRGFLGSSNRRKKKSQTYN